MRVLLVEDEESLAKALVRGLGAEGFAVDHVSDGAEGFWQAKEYPYDVVILDIMLPKMNGYDVARRLRDAGVWTPILMLTAKDGEYDEADALDLGADDYLTKPFHFVVLVARLRALLRRGAPERPAVLNVDDLELDPAAHTCRRGERDIPLTPREFALLEYLMRNHGRVVSKNQILTHVWAEDFRGDPNLVEVYVGYLRKKVDAPFGCKSIRTVRGAGYLLGRHDA
ncbi:MAG: response regulator transcription factor [Streptosporangiales bacterium]|nr:response regulator transcription factor [Streptosporangiales bacterium]MBO0891502.1 response regulator transcription factor [Acidothermales bacterium]